MKPALRNHLENHSLLSQKVIDEVCAMFADEANNLLDTLADLQPDIRGVILDAVRDYHKAIEVVNRPTFTHVAKIMAVNDVHY